MSEQPKRTVKSFSRRVGRLTSGQQYALENHWDTYGLKLPTNQTLDLKKAFNNNQPIVLEIGFGNGESLLTMAEQRPSENFIGVEVHDPGIGHSLAEIHKRGINNLRLIHADAIDVINSAIAPASLSRIQIFFPDPWPKKRHHKRRLLQPAFAKSLVPLLAPQGCLHFATDWQPYAEYALTVLQQTEGLINQSPSGDYSSKPSYRPQTKFEARGLRLGHEVWDLLFVLKDYQNSSSEN